MTSARLLPALLMAAGLTVPPASPVHAVLCEVDADGDSLGDAADAGTADPDGVRDTGFVDNHLDCDDADTSVNPGAVELYGDSIDNNCDGQTDEGCVDGLIVVTGDVNQSPTIGSSDLIVTVNYVFKTGPEPVPCPAAADVHCDGVINSSDILYMCNFTFKGGSPPCDVCELIPQTWSCP